MRAALWKVEEIWAKHRYVVVCRNDDDDYDHNNNDHNNNNKEYNVYGAVIMASRFESLPGSYDEYGTALSSRLSAQAKRPGL